MIANKGKEENKLSNLFAKKGKFAPSLDNIKDSEESYGKKLVFRMKMGDVLEPYFFIRNRLSLTRKEAQKLSFIGPNLIRTAKQFGLPTN